MMQQANDRLHERVAAAWPRDAAPDFDATLHAAQERLAARGRNVRRFAAAAALAAIAAIAMFGNAPREPSYIELAELMESTYWTAPSDVLLPDRQFDIYQDMPALFESTEPAGGTLL